MTDGQWIWMLVHMELDKENQLNSICNECKSDMERDKCISCGKTIHNEEYNESFNEELYQKLKKKSV